MRRLSGSSGGCGGHEGGQGQLDELFPVAEGAGWKASGSSSETNA